MRQGEILVGKYRVDRVLGQGGMGLVVQAMHLQLAQPVAVKFLLPEVLAHPGVVERFLREAQAAVRLRSEHVARVIDVGTLETGAPYMVLEYLDGTDLASFPRAQLDLGTIVDLMLQACEALAEAHALGIVHRDIKPANFFITRRADGSPLLKVLDFGISKVTSQMDSSLTATQTVIGTPAYMSPEQMKSAKGVDHRSDIWSLGVVLYELLEGIPPFEGETFTSLAIKVATEPVRPMMRRYPPGVAELVLRCLDKDPARRFQNVAELAGALAPFARSHTQAAITLERTSKVLRSPSYPSLPATIAAQSPGTLTGASGAFTQGGAPGKKRWPLFALGGAVVAGVVVVAVVLGGGKSPAGDAAGGSSTSTSTTTAPPVPTPPVPTPPIQTPPIQTPPAQTQPPPTVDTAGSAAHAGSADIAGTGSGAATPGADPAAGSGSAATTASTAHTGHHPGKRPPNKPTKPTDSKPPPTSGNGADDILDGRQ